MRSILFFSYIFSLFSLFSLGCGTVGKAFDEKLVDQIRLGSSKKEDIQRIFGKPFRTGKENGQDVWIYEHNIYSVVGPGSSKDLIIVFDDQGSVLNHQILSSSP